MDTESTAVKIAELARRLERLAAEVRELKALYADVPRRGALRTLAWREAYERRFTTNHSNDTNEHSQRKDAKARRGEITALGRQPGSRSPVREPAGS